MTVYSHKVSVIVRTKDRPRLLQRALQSIADQQYRMIEVILVNDGGCVLDLEVLINILGDIPLTYIRLEQNRGRSHAGNVGIANAKGDYIGFLDDDDELFPEHVSTLMSSLSNGACKVAYTDSLMAHREYDSAFRDFRLLKEELVFSQDFDFGRLLFENYIPFMCPLFEREVLSEAGGFATDLDLYEDWDLLLRIGEKYSFSHIPKITAYYIQWNSVSQISQNNQNSPFLKQAYLKILSRHWDQITIQRVYSYILETVTVRTSLKDCRKTALLNDRIKAERIGKLEAELKERERLLVNYQIDLRDKEVVIKTMTETFGWRVLERYRHMRNKMQLHVPKDIKNPVVQGLNVLRKQGLKAVVRKANKKLLFNKSVKQTISPVGMTDLSVHASGYLVIDEPVRAKVSIIIPTKNAGDEFDYTLRRIVQQEGVEEIELIIIDSGSQDRTLEIGKRYTNNVFQIPPEEFHHGETRNIGAEKAGGEFLVFMVQDAIPVGPQWLYKLIRPIRDGQASAVTVRQVPRSDADLFASWSIWGYNQYLGYDSDRIADITHSKQFADLDLHEKRKAAGLDNVCLGLKREIFNRHRFRKSYAEDLDLGTRLVQDGHVLMFLSSNAVVHSHTKSTLYLFKRFYVDTVSMLDILGGQRKDLPSEMILGAASCLYCSVKMAAAKMKYEKERNTTPEMLVHSFVLNLRQGITAYDPSWKSLQGDPLLDEYFSTIAPINHPDIISEILEVLTGNIMNFESFIQNVEVVRDIEADLMKSIFKFFGSSAGSYLGSHSLDRMDSFFRGI